MLEQTFSAVELVGKSVSIGHVVRSSSVGAFISATIHNYTPYLRINSDTLDAGEDRLIVGTDFQETFTNFPFGNTILTGEFLTLDLSSPQLDGSFATKHIEKTLFDRIGFEARQTGARIALPSDLRAAFSPQDVTTLLISGASTPNSQTISTLPFFEQLQQQAQAIQLQLQSNPMVAALNISKAIQLGVVSATRNNALIGTNLLADSDNVANSFSQKAFTRRYFHTPRVVSVATNSLVPADAERQLRTEVDILSDVPRVVAAPGQNPFVEKLVRYFQGLSDSSLEGKLFHDFLANETTSSAYDTYNQAVHLGYQIVAIDRSNLLRLQSLPISIEARQRIAASVQNGSIVQVPAHEVVVNGKATVAWLEFDPTTGFVIAVAENGTHNGQDYPALLISVTEQSDETVAAAPAVAAADMTSSISLKAILNVLSTLSRKSLSPEEIPLRVLSWTAPVCAKSLHFPMFPANRRLRFSHDSGASA